MAKFNISQINGCKILMVNFIFENDVFINTNIIIEDESGNQYTLNSTDINSNSTNSEIKEYLNSELIKVDKIEPIITKIENKVDLVGKYIKDI